MKARTLVKTAVFSCVALVAYAAWLQWEAQRSIDTPWIEVEA